LALLKPFPAYLRVCPLTESLTDYILLDRGAAVLRPSREEVSTAEICSGVSRTDSGDLSNAKKFD
jgi:hypothetical protein